MKRTLITFTALYLLYERQRRVERRQLAWKRGIECVLLRNAADLREWTGDVNRGLDEFGEGYHKWGNGLMEEINDALKAAFKEGAP